MTEPESLSITWPERFRPEVAPAVSRVGLEIAAPAEAIWAQLVRAAEWSDWYHGADDVTFDLWQGPDLRAGTMFSWTISGVRLRSVVNEFEPFSRLGWYARGDGVEAWHGWVLDPTGDGRTYVLTEESLIGTAPRFATGLGEMIDENHRQWLRGLAERAGAPVAD